VSILKQRTIGWQRHESRNLTEGVLGRMLVSEHRQIPLRIHGRWVSVDCGIASVVRLANRIPGIASNASCQGGLSNTQYTLSGHSHSPAYLQLVPAEFVWADLSGCQSQTSGIVQAKARLVDVTHRLQHKFEQRLGTPIAVTRAKNPSEAWRRKRISDLCPRLWLRDLSSAFYWNSKCTREMLVSIEDLLAEECIPAKF
jgi:hypothetical protein